MQRMQQHCVFEQYPAEKSPSGDCSGVVAEETECQLTDRFHPVHFMQDPTGKRNKEGSIMPVGQPT